MKSAIISFNLILASPLETVWPLLSKSFCMIFTIEIYKVDKIARVREKVVFMKELMFPRAFPKIETERLLLREITDEDRQAIFRNFSDPEVAKWFFNQPLTEMDQVIEIITTFRNEFKSGIGLTWAIAQKNDGECVGTCGFGDIELGQRGEIGFDLAKEHWGKGLMSEALAPVITYSFDILRLSKVEAHSYSTNRRAIRLLEKLGFQLEKISGDSRYYSISQDDLDRSSP